MTDPVSVAHSLSRCCCQGEARPFGKDERTVQLDVWPLLLSSNPMVEASSAADADTTVASVWDFGGQPAYAAGQQQ